MDCKCLRCDGRFILSEDEAARCRLHYERRGITPPEETVGICRRCWVSEEVAEEPPSSA